MFKTETNNVQSVMFVARSSNKLKKEANLPSSRSKLIAKLTRPSCRAKSKTTYHYVNKVLILKSFRKQKQSCKSGRAFRVGFGFGRGSRLTLMKVSGLIRCF